MPRTANAQWAHDIRNTLGTVALYVDTLNRLSGVQHADIVARTHALLAKAAAMCDAVVEPDRHSQVAPELRSPKMKARASQSSRVSVSNPSMSGLTLDPMERKARAPQDHGVIGAIPA